MSNLLHDIQKLIEFQNRIMEAYNNHPDEMNAAKADHAFVLKIHAIIDDLYPNLDAEAIDKGLKDAGY